MHRRPLQGIFLLIVLLLPIIGAQAQQEDHIDESQPPLASRILSVNIERDSENELILIVEWMSTNCLAADFAYQVANNVISVQVYNPEQLDGLACESPEFGEETFFLGDDFQNDESYAVIINDFVAEFYLPRPDGVLLDSLTQLVPVGETELIATPVSFSTIEEVTVEVADDETLHFSLSGEHPDACGNMAYAHIVPNFVDETQHIVEVFRFWSPFINCPAEPVPYELTLESGLTAGEVQFVVANQRLYEWLPDTAELTFVEEIEEQEDLSGNNRQVFTVIESVDVTVLESFPMRLELTIQGYQSDGCEVPVHVDQQVDGNDVTVSIYRELPIDVMCAAVVVPYEETIMVDGTFEGGTVHIQVNEFAVILDL